MTLALNDNFDGLTDFSRVKSVGIIVDVGDLLSGELYDHVTSFQSGFIRRAIAANSGKFYPGNLGGVIRDRTDVDAKIVAARSEINALAKRVMRSNPS